MESWEKLRDVVLLELERGHLANGAMSPPPVVEHLDILEDFYSCLVVIHGLELLNNNLNFESAKEALHGSIVIAVTFARHATDDVMVRQNLLVLY